MWNTSAVSLSGVAAFHADYMVRPGFTLSKISVKTMDGTLTPSSVLNFQGSKDTGETERRRIVFDLAFEIRELPAWSYTTYFASYAAEAEPEVGLRASDVISGSVVVLETLCRAGELPAAGSFDKLSPFMLY